MRAVIFSQPGNASVLQIGEIDQPKPGPNQLLVKVHATALNRADISQRRGTYPPPPGHSEILGLEIAGVVAGIGENVKDYKIDDRVFGLVDGGGYAEYCLLDQAMAMVIPSNLDFIQAAAIPEVFLTAQTCLFQLGDLKKSESILIHAGGSGVGTAAIQMAKYIGAKVFITAGSEKKLQKCRELGADFAINYKTQDFFTEIKKINNDKGVDVILDPVGADYFEKNIQLLNVEGRIIQIAKMSGDDAKFSIGRLIMKRLQIKGNSMRSRSLEEKRAITKIFKEKWLPLITEGKIKPIIDSTFPIKDVQKAHEYMESNRNFGKVILSID